MNFSRLCLTLCVLAPPVVASAATTDPPVEPSGSVLLAAADPSAMPMHVGKAAADARPTSAGMAEALPDLPVAIGKAFTVRTVLRYPASGSDPGPAVSPRFRVVAAALPVTPVVSLLQASPLAWPARHIGAQHFNTQDGSSVDAFAICYRLSNRSSVQVIPGDPAPVKIPVTAMANNMGVTVGMVVRLSRTR